MLFIHKNLIGLIGNKSLVVVKKFILKPFGFCLLTTFSFFLYYTAVHCVLQCWFEWIRRKKLWVKLS